MASARPDTLATAAAVAYEKSSITKAEAMAIIARAARPANKITKTSAAAGKRAGPWIGTGRPPDKRLKAPGMAVERRTAAAASTPASSVTSAGAGQGKAVAAGGKEGRGLDARPRQTGTAAAAAVGVRIPALARAATTAAAAAMLLLLLLL